MSRLRRHLKTHWQKEVALLAALGVLVTIFVLVLRKGEPEPIANEDSARAEELRKAGVDECRAAHWNECLEKLDAAARLDPAGESRPEVRQAREDARKALSVPPAPTTSGELAPPPAPTTSGELTPPPAPTTSGRLTPAPSAAPPLPTEKPRPAPIPTTTSAPTKPAPKKPVDSSSFGPSQKQAPAPPSKVPPSEPDPRTR